MEGRSSRIRGPVRSRANGLSNSNHGVCRLQQIHRGARLSRFWQEWVAGQMAVWAAYCRRMLVLIVSATELQVVGQTMKEVRAAWRAAGAVGQLFTRSVRIGSEDRIIALTGGSSIDSLTGWHDPNGVFVIISEAQGERLEDSAYDAALAVATDDLSRVLVMGNPTRPSGRFYEVCQRDHWAEHHVSC